MHCRRIAVIAMVVLAGLSGDADALDRIGVASVVKNEVSGTISGNTRVIGIGAQIFQNEVVTTGPNSSAQLLFRDQTTLTIGADARISLDRFVYNPQTRTGDIVINTSPKEPSVLSLVTPYQPATASTHPRLRLASAARLLRAMSIPRPVRS